MNLALAPLTTREPSICRCGHSKGAHVPIPGAPGAVRCIRWHWVPVEGSPNTACRCRYFYAPNGGLLDP